jgi:hypothetical protein
MIKDDLHIKSNNKLPVENRKEMSSTKAAELQRQQKFEKELCITDSVLKDTYNKQTFKKELYNTKSILQNYQPETRERRRARRER